ncbi:hypothetical protein GUJ93_ZPchr0010g7402 [Zizania palustris]|uniref:Uncharacterized protein n=1 Tax=Zizania palustris TaxID=103762 RepID=A0A8J6BJP3_ZIZPA|nr:hypothetical protein GUJ93_ZPchr0010g7402 [Zizania palustris]
MVWTSGGARVWFGGKEQSWSLNAIATARSWISIPVAISMIMTKQYGAFRVSDDSVLSFRIQFYHDFGWPDDQFGVMGLVGT